MKIAAAFFSLLLFTISSPAQQPALPAVPENLKTQFAIINNAYPKVEAKRFPKAPADSVWLFRSGTASSGTVEVGFKGDVVVYMVFRRGTGGTGWKVPEIKAIHMTYHQDLLKETYDPARDLFSKYNHSIAAPINAAVITKKDFDAKALMSGS